MRLVVGLGNPGQDYARNRHNVGFMAVDEIIRRHHLPDFRTKARPHGNFSEGRVGTEKIVLLKPLSFMNASGKPVGDAMRYFRLDPGNVFIFHDEIDLAPGKVRVKKGGGHAGHNGIRDIEKHIGKDFWRIRLGVGRPRGDGRVSGHVLGDFSRADKDWLEPMLEAAADQLPLLLAENTSDYMSRIAMSLPAPKKKEEG